MNIIAQNGNKTNGLKSHGNALEQLISDSEVKRNPSVEAFELLKQAGHSAEVLEQMQNMLHDSANHEEEAPAFEFLDFDDFQSLPDPEYLVEGIITKQTIGMIYGEPGAGKSFIAIDIAMDMAIGSAVAGRWETARPLSILYATSEGQTGLKPRFTAALNKRVNDHPNIKQQLKQNLQISLKTPQLFDARSPQSVDNFILEYQQQGRNLDVIIIDTLNNASLGANENDSRDMTIVAQNAKRISESLGCAVLLVHHSNRNGSYRGSSALHGAMDVMISLNNTTQGRELHIFKLKDHKPDGPRQGDYFYFDLQGDHVSQSAYVNWFGDEANEQAAQQTSRRLSKLEIAKQEIEELLAETDQAMSQSQIVEHISQAGRNITLSALKELEQSGQLIVQQGQRNSKIYQLKLDL